VTAYRYAVFYAPPPESPLERFGVAWLGRHHGTGRLVPQTTVPGLPPERLQQLTEAPRRYGFHGTLKAPFRLAAGQSADAVHAAVAAFATARRAFLLPPLRLADLDGFLALVPSLASPALADLAAGCVRAFEPFRAPLTSSEIASRRPEHLSERQRRQLEIFGYPFVLDDFAFHMTLTRRLTAAERTRLWPALAAAVAPIEAAPFIVDAIAVFEEPAPGAPFVMTGRHPLTNV